MNQNTVRNPPEGPNSGREGVAGPESPLEVIALQRYPIDAVGVHLAVPLRRGRQQFRFLIDTGASNTVLDQTKFRGDDGHPHGAQLSVQTAGAGGGRHTVTIARISGLKLGKVALPCWDVAGLDFSGIRNAYRSQKLPVVSGILGGDVLHYYRARIDYGLCVLELYPPHADPPFG